MSKLDLGLKQYQAIDDILKTYLAKYTIHDGEHEHNAELVIKAQNFDKAVELAKEQEHGDEVHTSDNGEECELKYWDYGDGSTIAELDSVQEITKVEADTLNRLGVAYYLN